MSALHQVLLMAGVVASDPYWAYVKSLLHFEGGLTDSATPSNSWTADAGAFVTNAGVDVLAGSYSLDCSTSASDRIADSGTIYDLGTADFCAEIVFRDDGNVGRNEYLFLMQGGATSQTVRVYSPAGSGQSIFADVSGGGPSLPVVACAFTVIHHVALTRNGSNWTLWLDGASAKTWTNSTFNTGASGTSVWVGGGSSTPSGMMAILDEWRLTIGVPRYTAPFTPTYPFPNY